MASLRHWRRSYFLIPPHPILGTEGLLFSFVVGILAGLGSSLLTVLVNTFQDLFHKQPVDWMWWPVIGGFFIGIGGLIDPRALGIGYDTIRDLLSGRLVDAALVILLIVKMLIWSLALGSGTSGGVLAPLLIVGGAIGATE